jgi:hypothetical protein
MGNSSSAAVSYVDQCLTAGISVVNEAVADAQAHSTQELIFNFAGCKNITISNWDVSQMVQIDLTSMAKMLVDNDVMNDMKSAISNAAESEAKAGLSFADSRTEVISDITMKLSTEIKNSCRALASSLSSQLIAWDMPYCENANVSFMKFGQQVKMVSSVVTDSENVNKVKQELVSQVEQHATSKATGLDPTAMVLIIVLVVLVVVGAPILGGMKLLGSPWLWMIVGVVAGLSGFYFDISTQTHTWPSKKGDTDSKRKNLLIGGTITGGIGSVIAIVSGLLIAKRSKKL